VRVTWVQPEDLVGHELNQAREEGKQVDEIEARWFAAGGSPAPPKGASPDRAGAELRALAGRIAGQQSLRWRPAGTVVVVQGPRFSTRAESRWYSGMGWDIVGMTQYPEVILARELEMCYLNLSLVTDYDAGLEGAPDVSAVQAREVMRVLSENIVRVRDLLAAMIPMIPAEPSCNCQRSLEGARL